jgi:regulatory protein
VQAAYRQIAARRDKKYDCTTEKGMAALARYFSSRGFGPSMIRLGLALAKEEAGTVWQEK